ncbi:hypothetical protein Tsubulata_029609 [Turnera subulata]|uniref:Uncharacterized protein n=1 Tax=Turnera subulata TaxID=218843 RepID=A0A9Q0JF00_9ROSI|nr:hypothetical protein Tsubulata_029609 [Turnera subulata]
MMCCCCGSLKDRIQNWIRDYDRLQHLAVILIYIQIGCALIGSLGASYNGVLLVNFGIAIFALVAIESSSQSLGRTYAVLLFLSLLLDAAWFFLFLRHIWYFSDPDHPFLVFSLKLTLTMQIIGCSVRFSSSFLWFQIYRLGVSYSPAYPDPSASPAAGAAPSDFDLRHSFLTPLIPSAANPATAAITRQCSDSDAALGGSIYDPAYYSSLFEDASVAGQDNNNNHINHIANNSSAKSSFGEAQVYGITDNGSTSSAGSSRLKLSIARSFQAIDVSVCYPDLKPSVFTSCDIKRRIHQASLNLFRSYQVTILDAPLRLMSLMQPALCRPTYGAFDGSYKETCGVTVTPLARRVQELRGRILERPGIRLKHAEFSRRMWNSLDGGGAP